MDNEGTDFDPKNYSSLSGADYDCVENRHVKLVAAVRELRDAKNEVPRDYNRLAAAIDGCIKLLEG